MKNNQAGFSIAIVIVVAALAAVVLGGIYIWSQRGDADGKQGAASQNQSPKTYTDTAKEFTFKYPHSWTAINPPHCCEGPIPDPAVVPSPIELRYPDAPKMNNDTPSRQNMVTVAVTAAKERGQIWGEAFKDAEASAHHGYELLATQTTEQYGYRDHLFLVSNATHDVVFRFRAMQTAKAGLGAAAFDESDKLSQIRTIVESVRFR